MTIIRSKVKKMISDQQGTSRRPRPPRPPPATERRASNSRPTAEAARPGLEGVPAHREETKAGRKNHDRGGGDRREPQPSGSADPRGAGYKSYAIPGSTTPQQDKEIIMRMEVEQVPEGNPVSRVSPSTPRISDSSRP